MLSQHTCAKPTATSPSACYNTLRNHANVDQKCLFTDGGGRSSRKTAHSDVPFSILRHAVLDKESEESEIGHVWAKVTSKKHCQSIPIQLCKRNQTTRNAISVCPEVAPDARAT